MEPPITVVGIGADGWAGLTPEAQRAITEAEVLVGGARQLDLVPTDTQRVPWPSPLLPALEPLLAEHAGRRICVLASGDPMLFGIGGTLVRLLGPDALRIVPHLSSVSLACARLGWPVEDVEVVSLVGRPAESLLVLPNRRVMVLSSDGGTPARVAALLQARGFGPTEMTVLEDVGGPGERRRDGVAATWPAEPSAALNLIALDVRGAPGVTSLGRTPGLPDDAYEHDGQITKREVRAVTLAALGPLPGQLLWDVGAGSGSVGIEWMRTHPSCRAVAVESRADRIDRIGRNATMLAVPGLAVVHGKAPDALDGLPAPDAIFVGGGISGDGVLEACWAALPEGGRLVANAVTLESEAVLIRWQATVGGTLTRLEVSRAAPVGGFSGWKPMMPVTQWVVEGA